MGSVLTNKFLRILHFSSIIWPALTTQAVQSANSQLTQTIPKLEQMLPLRYHQPLQSLVNLSKDKLMTFLSKML